MTPAKRVVSSTTVDVERRAEETANVPKQESSAQFCVTVKAGASITMECKLCDATNTDICDRCYALRYDLKDILFTDLN